MPRFPAALGLAIALATGVLLGCWAAISLHQPATMKSPDTSASFIPSLDNTPGFPSIKNGDFRLIDQHGNERTSASPDGEYQLLFFGYTTCKAICSVALPTMAEATDLLEALGHPVTPVLITVDPERDTIAALRETVPEMHRKMVGLTGSDEALSEAYKTFQITKKFVFKHPDEGDVYTHGSNIFLLSPDGKFKTLLPPITSPVRIAEIAAGYIREDSGGKT
ncbi:MAG: SCO family protein [Rhizobiaceae bacterium]